MKLYAVHCGRTDKHEHHAYRAEGEERWCSGVGGVWWKPSKNTPTSNVR